MTEKVENTKKFILVDMYEAEISSEDKPIIGTSALATCVGVLLYSAEKKKAIVAHVAPGQIDIIERISTLLIDNDLIETKIKYKIIPGYYEEHYNTKETLEENFSCFTSFTEEETSNNAIKTNEEYQSREFAFDASSGKFVTDKVLFNEEYYIINNKEIKPNKRR